MGTFLKVIGGVSLLVVAAIIYVTFFSKSASGYTPSDTVLSANEIAKNPYKYKGMSGIMNPSMMHFSNMAGDETAVYDMNFVFSADQLSVTMDNNDPPSTNRWWKVYVEGASDFTNRLGATVTIGEVRFEGYADPPPQAQPPYMQPTYIAPPVPPQDQPAPQPQPAPATTTEPDQTSPDGTQPAAPIERKPPPQE
jgi:hypothetical protein